MWSLIFPQLKMGRECIDHYSLLHRFCVFSHDELVCAMSVRPDSLDSRTAAAAYEDILRMYEFETKMRKSVNQWVIIFTIINMLIDVFMGVVYLYLSSTIQIFKKLP